MTVVLLALTALPFVISPGASFAITVDAVSHGDHRAPAKVWAGTSAGILVVVSVAALSGIGSLLDTYETARHIFRLLGGAVLILLGLSSGIRALSSMREPSTSSRPKRRLIPWSFIALVTNIKALTLYTSVVPHLRSVDLNPAALLFAFAIVHIVMLFAWQALLGLGVRRIPRVSTSSRIRGCISGLAALSLVAIGVQNLLELLQ